MVDAPTTQLVVMRHAPYGSSLARAAIDVSLAAAAFDQAVEVLFMGEGVLQLLPDQSAEAVNAKNLGKMIASFELYGIETLYVDKKAIEQYGVAPSLLPSGARLLDDTDIRQLLENADHLLGF